MSYILVSLLCHITMKKTTKTSSQTYCTITWADDSLLRFVISIAHDFLLTHHCVQNVTHSWMANG